MEQHAVPQNISSYEFRLVGDMTLKQFFQLAGGIVLGVITFRLPIPVFIKYPFVFVFVMVGILMAFVPIMGRPFTAWVSAFFRAIYSPTEFTWAPDTEVPILANAPPQTIVIPTATSSSPTLTTAPTVVVPEPVPVKDAAVVLPEVTKVVSSASGPLSNPQPTTNNLSSQTTFSSYTPPPKPIVEIKPQVPSPIIGEGQGEVSKKTATNNPQPTTNNIPLSTLPPVTIPLKNVVPAPTSPIKPSTNNLQPTTNNSVPIPTSPNVLAGMVTDKAGTGLDAAIVEIIDSLTQVPSRALRTNRTGMFQIVTPLKSGTYEIHAEKDGFTFSPISIVAAGKIISPIVIKANA